MSASEKIFPLLNFNLHAENANFRRGIGIISQQDSLTLRRPIKSVMKSSAIRTKKLTEKNVLGYFYGL